MTSELKPCPFCGSTASVLHYRLSRTKVYECDQCSARLDVGDTDDGEAWNTRPAERSTAWLIEWPASGNLPVRWWNPVGGWCIDANDATRFVRFEDAQDTIAKGCFVKRVKPTQHVFLPLHRPNADPDKFTAALEAGHE